MDRRYFTALIVAFALVACGIVAKIIYDRTRQIELVIATGSAQGEYYAMGQAFARVLPRHIPRLRLQVRETKGATENLALVAEGKADLGFVQNDTDTKPPIRAIAGLYLETFHLVARPGVNIREFGDIRGKRVVTPPPGSGAYNSFLELLRHYDIDLQDIQPIHLAGPAASQALVQGQVDALFRVIGSGNLEMRRLLQQSRGRLVPIDQAAAIQIFYPETEPAVIPRGTYSASPPVPPQDLPTVGVRSLLITHQRLDKEIIRDITRVLFEYRNDLVTLNPRTASISYPGSGQALGIPLHPGARAYYERDKPSFLQENAEPIALLITLATIGFSLLAQIRSQISERQKNRADLYNLELVEIIEAVDRAESVQELDKARQRLLSIFRRVIEDLDKDRLSPESYQLFVFPWEMAMNTLRHREALLLSKTLR
ncbi:MAG: TAXI family TRAP transporter solute-binding subunit [Gloeomargarita sp. SKYBB_i_bin120]|nr:TAXI family TRAP transporter solute-binding subunit [Gloeomargarita sp. SKYG98]MCS7293103.1 TAXI family TRAP transporter solute-binding subunit [Gloeomargarita sp. SKYB120]MDW8178668.1 TAXI family TRAP transporter solute-binding subunit [Gloeomargarita sp. SKYBB_i_bin120]